MPRNLLMYEKITHLSSRQISRTECLRISWLTTADSPTGPFTYTGAAKTVTNSSWGDQDLFVDDDGTGYLLGTRIGGGVPAEDSRRVIVEQLAPSVLSFARKPVLLVSRTQCCVPIASQARR